MSRGDSGLGIVISAFVEDRIGRLNLPNINLWCEAAYVSLFSVTFEVFVLAGGSWESCDALDEDMNSLIADVAEDAERWVGQHFQKDFKDTTGLGVRVQFDSAPIIRKKLRFYFEIALAMIADRECKLADARSQACLEGLTQSLDSLLATEDVSKIESTLFLNRALIHCDQMVKEVNSLISQHLDKN